MELSTLIPDSPLQIPEERVFDDDFADLDALLAKAMADKPKRLGQKVKEAVGELLEQRAAQVTWEVQEYIAVWTRVDCLCKVRGVITFVRFMRKMQHKQTKSTHWETIAEIPKGEHWTNTLVKREVVACEHCRELKEEELKDFSEYVKP